MASQGLPVERLREYLLELQPEARALLVRALERGQLGGNGVPGADLIIEALRPSFRTGVAPTRIGNPARLFFRPLEPFLVDAGPASDLPGRMDRASIAPLWQWICRDLAAEDGAAYTADAAAALLAGDTAAADALALAFQDRVAAAITAEFARAEGDERAIRRMLGQIGLPHGLADLTLLHTALRHRDVLSRLAGRLPVSINNLGEDQVGNILGLVRQGTVGAPQLLLPMLVVVMNRLASPWQMIRLAVRAVESDVASRVMQGPLALAGTLVFADIRYRVELLRGILRRGQFSQAGGLCRDLHDAIRGLRTEMNLAGETAWSRDLAGLRSEISTLLKAEIEATPAAVRRLLRGRRETVPGAVLDADEIAEAEGRIEFSCACRNYAGELAINQIAAGVVGELQAYFDGGMPILLDALRLAEPANRKFRQSQVDAAVRLAGKLFGAEYAGLLSRAAGVAAAERKPAKA